MSTLSLRTAIPARFFPRLLAVLAFRTGLHRQRAHLVALDDHLLRDIGITRTEVLLEARRPVWDAPAHWVQ